MKHLSHHVASWIWESDRKEGGHEQGLCGVIEVLYGLKTQNRLDFLVLVSMGLTVTGTDNKLASAV